LPLKFVGLAVEHDDLMEQYPVGNVPRDLLTVQRRLLRARGKP
jgi:hypothetical protein